MSMDLPDADGERGASIKCAGVTAFSAKSALIVFGRPMIALDLTRDSRIRRVMLNCSDGSTSACVVEDEGCELPCSRACLYTVGIKCGRLSVDRAVAVRR
jgi:hypothetical protein